MEDMIKHFMKETQASGLFRELRRREYFLTRTQWRRFKDKRAQTLREKAAVKRVARYHKFYNEKR